MGFIEIQHLGSTQKLEIAQTPAQLTEAKTLDDLAFGGHLGISMEELTEISAHGAVLLLRDPKGRLTGETQVITSPISQHPNLPYDEAYNYGTAIHPNLQNRGFAQILFKGQEQVAIEAGKVKNTLTVRLENAQSLRGRFKLGYTVTGYNPNCYGPIQEGGARLIMEKHHFQQRAILGADPISKLVTNGNVLIVGQENVKRIVQSGQAFIGIPIAIGDQTDFSAHYLVASAFETGKFIGIGLLKPSEFNSNQTESLFVLQHK